MRCFISINVSKEIQDKIKEIQNKLPEFVGKKTKPENLHLTLKFLGCVEESEIKKIKKKLQEIKSKKFEAKVDKIGVFSKEDIRILWLHLTNCEDLQKQVDEKLKSLFKKERRFMSHLTIARVKKCDKEKFLKKLKKMKIKEIKFAVNKFYLMKSELTFKGPKYEIIEEYKIF